MRKSISISNPSRNDTSSSSTPSVSESAGIDELAATKAFRVLNQMLADGVLHTYALGGAMGAFFYIEPDTTFDMDVFCAWQDDIKNGLVNIEPIYSYLKEKGYQPQNTGVNIEGCEVQFFSPSDSLIEAAMQEAKTDTYQGVPVRVISPEYLVAIMLQVGRRKDRLRILRFLETGAFDPPTLSRILSEHGLEEKWATLEQLDRQIDS